jgi:hypothetical protein
LALYRQADKLLVNDDVVAILISYSGAGTWADLAKPWVTNLKRDSLGYIRFKDVTIKHEDEDLS